MNFKELRDFIGWERGEPMTFRDMEAMTGIITEGSSWVGWENGTRIPSLKSIAKICKTFNVVFTMYPEGEISFDRE